MGLLDQSLISITALLVGLLATPLVRFFALRFGIVDRPGAKKVHAKATPLLGGVAIYAATVLALVLFVDDHVLPQLIPPLLGGSLLAFLGVWDDRHGLSARLRLLAMVLIALGVFAAGIRVQLFQSQILNMLLTVVWIVGITNAFNLMDNMDGLTGGIAAAASFFFLILSLVTGQYIVGCIAAALLGACLGFLVFNFSPASIFMGDAGSLFIGFILALLGIKIQFVRVTSAVSWAIPVMVLLLPIFDTTLVTISRIRRGEPIWIGGKDHVSHRLHRLGLSTRMVAVTLYGVSILMGLTGVGIYLLRTPAAYWIIPVVFVLVAAFLFVCETRCEAVDPAARVASEAIRAHGENGQEKAVEASEMEM